MPILFLCGDVMTGRGIDQILPHPAAPHLHESYLSSALQYLEIAEEANGPIPRPVDFDYVWGDALRELERVAPDLRIVNLETAVTVSEAWQPKGINYRMNPANVPCLAAAGIDCCVLANNHVLDWGEAGLTETIETLTEAGVAIAGAGRNLDEAQVPAVLGASEGGRFLVFAFGHGSSGVPAGWEAAAHRPGVNRLPDLSEATARNIAGRIRAVKQSGDIVVVSVHWGGNWGYDIPAAQQSFAHALIDAGGADILHGHSSHHPKGIEIYRDRLILYGCGDFLNDYEGIEGHDQYRDDLALMYFPELDAQSSKLRSLQMTPMQIRNFRLNRPASQDIAWLHKRLDRECRTLGTKVDLLENERFVLQEI